MFPLDGDVLVSHPSATVAHEVSIVPAAPDVVYINYKFAIARAHELARDRQVDAWVTADHTHFMKIAAFRRNVLSPRPPVSAGSFAPAS